MIPNAKYYKYQHQIHKNLFCVQHYCSAYDPRQRYHVKMTSIIGHPVSKASLRTKSRANDVMVVSKLWWCLLEFTCFNCQNKFERSSSNIFFSCGLEGFAMDNKKLQYFAECLRIKEAGETLIKTDKLHLQVFKN